MDCGRARLGPGARRIRSEDPVAEGSGGQPPIPAADRQPGFRGVLRALGGLLLHEDGQHEAAQSRAERQRLEQPVFAPLHLQPDQRRRGQRRLGARAFRDLHALRRGIAAAETLRGRAVFDLAGGGGFRGRPAPADHELRLGVAMEPHRRADQRTEGLARCRRRGGLRRVRGRHLRRVGRRRRALDGAGLQRIRHQPHGHGVRLRTGLLPRRQLVGNVLRQQRVHPRQFHLFRKIFQRRDVSVGGFHRAGDGLREAPDPARPPQRRPQLVLVRQRRRGLEQRAHPEERPQGNRDLYHGQPFRVADGGGPDLGELGAPTTP